MKLKKLAATLMAAALTLSLAACGGTGGSGTAPASKADSKAESKVSTPASTPESKEESASGGTVTLWAWDDTFNVKAAQMAAEAYKDVNPDVTVEVVSMAQDDIVAKLNTAFESGNVDGLPNVVLIEDYRIQNYLQSYPGELSDLSEVTSADKFMDYKLTTMTEDGKVYGVPFDSGVACVFYRTDLIEQAGYKPEDMQDLTWEKFIEIGKAVKEKTGTAMFSVDPNDLGLIRMMMQSAGKWYVDADGKADIKDNEALREALTLYKQMQDEDITITASGWDAGVGAVNEGDVACSINGCWYASSIKKAEDQSGKWAVAAFPRMSNVSSSVNASNCGGASWYVVDRVEGADLAKDFLKNTFASDEALLDDLCSAISLVSTYKAADKGENVNAPDEFFSGQSIYKDWNQWTQDIPGVNYGMSTYDIESKITETVQAVIGGTDLDEALSNAQVEVEGIVNAAG